MDIHNIDIHLIYMCSNNFKSCRFLFGYLVSKMFNLYIQCNKNWAWISMCWISICNNDKIDIYVHQINIHIYIWITLVNPHGSTAAGAIDGGPVGRGRKPSKLTMWCIYSASGLSC